MKKLLMVFALVLSGCSSMVAHQYDATEYDYAVRTSVAATRAVHQCPDRGQLFRNFAGELNTVTMQFYEYERWHAVSADSAAGVTELRQLTIDFVDSANTGTLRYCQHKLSEIQSASRVVAQALGGQQKLSMCGSDVRTRYNVYLESLNASAITKVEFDELVRDLERLAHVDASGCSLESKVQLKNALDAISAASKLLTLLP